MWVEFKYTKGLFPSITQLFVPKSNLKPSQPHLGIKSE